MANAPKHRVVTYLPIWLAFVWYLTGIFLLTLMNKYKREQYE